MAPQLTCGIPRSRFGLVWLVPLDQVVISEESRFFHGFDGLRRLWLESP